MCTRVAPVCVCSALSPHCREEGGGGGGRGAGVARSPALAGEVGVNRDGGILAEWRLPAGRWAATPGVLERALLTAEPGSRLSWSGGRGLPDSRVCACEGRGG